MSAEETQTTPVAQADGTSESKAGVTETSSAEAQDEKLSTKEADESEGIKEDVEDKPKKKSGIQRIKERHARELAEIRREIDSLKAQAPRDKREDESKPVEKPKADSFDSHEEYVEALADWKYDQRKKADDISQKEAQVKTDFQKTVEGFQSKVKEFQKTKKDFEDVLGDVDDIRMSVGVQETILSSDVGPQVMYELAKDRENYERINALSPLAAARELGRIEAHIHQRLESSNEEPKKNTSAPQPIKPVGGMSAGGAKKSVSDPDISFADYERLRREQMKRKRG